MTDPFVYSTAVAPGVVFKRLSGATAEVLADLLGGRVEDEERSLRERVMDLQAEQERTEQALDERIKGLRERVDRLLEEA